MDALTPAEYWVVYKAIRDGGHTEEKTLFSSVLLHEPDKQYVLAWKPGDPIERKADVVLYYKGHSYGALVNISTAKVESFEELKGAQAANALNHRNYDERERLVQPLPFLLVISLKDEPSGTKRVCATASIWYRVRGDG